MVEHPESVLTHKKINPIKNVQRVLGAPSSVAKCLSSVGEALPGCDANVPWCVW